MNSESEQQDNFEDTVEKESNNSGLLDGVYNINKIISTLPKRAKNHDEVLRYRIRWEGYNNPLTGVVYKKLLIFTHQFIK